MSASGNHTLKLPQDLQVNEPIVKKPLPVSIKRGKPRIVFGLAYDGMA